MAKTQAEPQRPMAAAVFTADELASKARELFGCTPEMAKAALLTAKKKKATQEEAAAIIEEFRGRRV